MLPSDLLSNSKGKNIMIELKNGDCINGTILNTDFFMNVKLKDAIYTNKKTKKFYKSEAIYIRANNIQSFTFDEFLLDQITLEKQKEQVKIMEKNNLSNNQIKNKKNFKENEFLNKKRMGDIHNRGRGNVGYRGRGSGYYKRGRFNSDSD